MRLKSYNSNRQDPNGFTLIELLVVVAVLGIIASIAIPVYRSYVAGAKREAANTSLAQFEILLESYRAENGRFPASGTYTFRELADGSPDNDNITNILPDFKPKGSAAKATSFHYSLTITDSGKSNETASYKAVGVNNIAGNNQNINATGSYK